MARKTGAKRRATPQEPVQSPETFRDTTNEAAKPIDASDIDQPYIHDMSKTERDQQAVLAGFLVLRHALITPELSGELDIREGEEVLYGHIHGYSYSSELQRFFREHSIKIAAMDATSSLGNLSEPVQEAVRIIFRAQGVITVQVGNGIAIKRRHDNSYPDDRKHIVQGLWHPFIVREKQRSQVLSQHNAYRPPSADYTVSDGEEERRQRAIALGKGCY